MGNPNISCQKQSNLPSRSFTLVGDVHESGASGGFEFAWLIVVPLKLNHLRLTLVLCQMEVSIYFLHEKESQQVAMFD